MMELIVLAVMLAMSFVAGYGVRAFIATRRRRLFR
jgi:hypothetical protein